MLAPLNRFQVSRPLGRKGLSASRPPIGALWGWAQVALARNATETLVRGPVLVLSPHPDDETIGCGLLLAQMAREGRSTAVALATDGRDGWFSNSPRPTSDRIAAIRRTEWHRALDSLHVPKERRFELGLADGTLQDHEDRVVEWISDLVRNLSPSQIFVTRPFDPHPDHRTLYRAACQSVIGLRGSASDPGSLREQISSGDRSDPPPDVYTYRVYPGEGLWQNGRPSKPTVAVTLLQLVRSVFSLTGRRPLVLRSARSKPEKKAAIEAYESQRRLLNGELRYVWRTGVEIYWKIIQFEDQASKELDR
jgi:LmbE family N-acetylglucosaminyl deacetylase